LKTLWLIVMSASKIEWTDRSDWNPVRGCTRVSPGCGGPGDNGGCYAEAMAARFSLSAAELEARWRADPNNTGKAPPAFKDQWGHGFAEIRDGKPRWTGKVELQEDRLTLPLHWRKPAKIFVNSTSDIFHEALSDEAIDKIFATMGACDDQELSHIFQILTKRAERQRDYVSSGRAYKAWNSRRLGRETWPARNIWLGVSCERQQEADERRLYLAEIAAAGWTTFCSYEPALGDINWAGWEFLDWLISGGESGARARASHPDWHRRARDFCAAHDIEYFFKQRGEWSFVDGADYDLDRIPDIPLDWRKHPERYRCMRADGTSADGYGGDSAEFFARVGKKAAGRLLDGVEHNGFPGRS
jgi:protein gp37